MSTDRETILARARAALAPLPQRAALPDWERELVILRAAQAPFDPWTLFAERLRAVNGLAFAGPGELVALLEKNNWRHGYCDPALWPALRHAFPDTWVVETVFDRARIDEYRFGITRATAAIAETGTLVLTDAGTPSRLSALAPWVHIAVIAPEAIFRDVPEAVASLPDDPNVIWITGPSKTADVEGILIEGVHGPGLQIALLAPAASF